MKFKDNKTWKYNLIPSSELQAGHGAQNIVLEKIIKDKTVNFYEKVVCKYLFVNKCTYYRDL